MSKDRIKSSLKTTGRAIGTATTVMLDATTNTRIREIDKQIEELQAERTRLESQLIRKP